MVSRRGCLGLLCALLATAGAADPVDPGMPEDAVATALVERPDDLYRLPVGPAGAMGAIGGAPAFEPVTGAVTWRAFRIDDPDIGLDAVMAGYRARLVAEGFEPRFECRGETCGGLDFRFEVALLPAPTMLMDAAGFAQLTATRAGPGGDPAAHVSVLASRVLGRLHMQTVTVVPAQAAPVPMVPSAAPARAPVGPLLQDISGFRERLLADGFARIEGLEFETGGARLATGSEPALDALARLLTADAALRVVVVGHSDNQGGLEANRALSLRRAEAVRDALIERGVSADQLAAEGLGYLAPLASNAGEDGRARNRRVELVLR